MIYNDWGIVFVPIAKNVTTSIHQILDKQFKHAEGHEHRTYNELSKIVDMNNYISISCVRNPYDRVYSAWKHVSKIDSDDNIDFKFRKFVKEWLEWYTLTKIHNDGHWSTQSSYIVEYDKVQVDWLFRFESISDDWKRFTDWYNTQGLSDKLLDDQLPNSNQTIKTKDPYDEETLAIVYNLYKQDFDMFGYNK